MSTLFVIGFIFLLAPDGTITVGTQEFPTIEACFQETNGYLAQLTEKFPDYQIEASYEYKEPGKDA